MVKRAQNTFTINTLLANLMQEGWITGEGGQGYQQDKGCEGEGAGRQGSAWNRFTRKLEFT